MQPEDEPQPAFHAELDTVRPAHGAYRLALAVLVVTGYVTPFLGAGLLAVAIVFHEAPLIMGMAAICCIALWIVIIHRAVADMRARGTASYRKAADVLVLAVLPIWGLFYTFLTSPTAIASRPSATRERPS